MNLPIELCDVKKSYPIGMSKRLILHGISAEIKQGEVYGFIGPNGAGKSTLINLLMGFTRPDSGGIRLNGRLPQDPLARKSIGYLPEGPRFYENLKAAEMLRFACQIAGMPKAQRGIIIDDVLSSVGILNVKNRLINTFSKGMKQRLGIALAMVHDPETFILDEPMSGLDPVGRDLLKRIIT